MKVLPMILIGEQKELLHQLKIKDNVVHVGLSQQPDHLKEEIS